MQVCQEFNTTWAWELEKKGYKEMTVECKTGILKVNALTDCAVWNYLVYIFILKMPLFPCFVLWFICFHFYTFVV